MSSLNLKIDIPGGGNPTIENEDVRNAYNHIREEGDHERWLIMENKRTGLTLTASGDGGLEPLQKKLEEKGQEGQILFGYIKFIDHAKDQERYVLVSFTPARASSLQKARRSVAVHLIESLFHHTVILNISDPSELTAEAISLKVKQNATSPSLNRASFLRTLKSLRSNGVVEIDPTTPVSFTQQQRTSKSEGELSSGPLSGSNTPPMVKRASKPALDKLPKAAVIAAAEAAAATAPSSDESPAAVAAAVPTENAADSTPPAVVVETEEAPGAVAEPSPEEAALLDLDKGGAEVDASPENNDHPSASLALPSIPSSKSTEDISSESTPTTPSDKRRSSTKSPLLDVGESDQMPVSPTSDDGSDPTKKKKKAAKKSHTEVITTTTEVKLSGEDDEHSTDLKHKKSAKLKRVNSTKRRADKKTHAAEDSSDSGVTADTEFHVKVDAAEDDEPTTPPYEATGPQEPKSEPVDKKKLALVRKESKRKANSLTKLDAIKFRGKKDDPALLAEAERAYALESSGHNKFGSDGGHSRGLSEDGEPYVAICDHLASTLDELMFLKGEQIFVIDKMSDTMWKGICSGVVGNLDPKDVQPMSLIPESTLSSSNNNSEDEESEEEEEEEDDEEEDEDKEGVEGEEVEEGTAKLTTHSSTKSSKNHPSGSAQTEFEDLTIETAVEWLDEAGFPQYADMFENGELVDEQFIQQSHELLSDIQIKALIRRVKYLNLSLEQEYLNAKGNSVAEDMEETEEPQEAHQRKENPFRLPPIRKMFHNASEEDKEAKLKDFRDKMKRSPSKRRMRQRMISELSSDELVHAEKLAMLQFTGLVEQKGSKFRDNLRWTVDAFKKTNKIKGDGKTVFGVDLSETVIKRGVRTTWSHGYIPMFMKNLIEFLSREGLNTEGIFRVPGNARKIENMREHCDKTGGPIDLVGEKVHDVAGLLKRYLHDLPDPLFTSNLYKNYAAVEKLGNKKQQIQALQLLSIMLPVAHRDLAAVMLKFMALLSNNKEVNKMTPDNLAVCLGPALFRDSREKSILADKKKELEKDADRQKSIRKVLTLMIEHQSLLWQVPVDLSVQLEQSLAAKSSSSRTTSGIPRVTSGSMVSS